MSTMTPTCIWEVQALLGEGALWDPVHKRVWFVDIKGKRIHRCAPDGGERRSWDAPGQVSFVVPTADGGIVCSLEDGLYRFNDADGSFTPLAMVEADQPGNRFNDGHVDHRGHLWFGSMHDSEEAPTGALYRFDGKHVAQMDDGYVITNGPALSPDGRTLYHTDTLDKRVYAFDVADDGSLSNKRTFVELAEGTKTYTNPQTGKKVEGSASKPGTHYYDGVIFHRIIDGFMIQGGDPTGTGTGGPGFTINDEVAKDLKYDKPGKLAMAKTSAPNSAGSQFFITVGAADYLTGTYTQFGEVIEGQDVVNKIAKVPVNHRDGDRPVEPVTIKTIRIERK
jgi:cyclophilin family peptidyl-prolyl cis-trans isomerase